MEQAPWAPYGTRTLIDLRLQRDRPRQGHLQPDLRGRPDQLPVQVAARRWLHTARAWTRRAHRRSQASAGSSPWRLACRRLRRNRVALAFLGLFVAIVVFVLAAPLWANNVAHTGPNETHTLEKVTVDGEKREVVNPEGKPIGPVWFGAGGKFFLGADGRLGRDEMVRLMYGGRTSLFIGIVSALITTLLATLLGPARRLLPGLGRPGDLALDGRALGLPGPAAGDRPRHLARGRRPADRPDHISGGSIWIPILIIGVVSTPYMARPMRGEVLSLREKEFVEAAVAQGAGSLRVMFGELLPNLWSTIIVFFTLNIANNMLLEAGALLPRRRRSATELVLGDDDRHRQRPDHQRAAADDHPRHDDPAHGALAERLRRRPA